MNSDFYVYRYTDPRNNEVIYVGKGKKQRVYSHLLKSSNKFLRHKIDKIRRAGYEPIIDFIATNIDEELAFLCEEEAIAKYGRISLGTGTLCNFVDGGIGRTISDYDELSSYTTFFQKLYDDFCEKNKDEPTIADCTHLMLSLSAPEIKACKKIERFIDFINSFSVDGSFFISSEFLRRRLGRRTTISGRILHHCINSEPGYNCSAVEVFGFTFIAPKKYQLHLDFLHRKNPEKPHLYTT